jgi:hypothetical protein
VLTVLHNHGAAASREVEDGSRIGGERIVRLVGARSNHAHRRSRGVKLRGGLRQRRCLAGVALHAVGGRGTEIVVGDRWDIQQKSVQIGVKLLVITGGLEVATHAIGDAALTAALEAYDATGATGSIEHAQLVQRTDVATLARLGLRASVQPAHLIDDRDLTDLIWADRTGACFALRWMLEAGVPVALGSDAPVAPLDPWLAIDAAVRRTGDDRPPWHPEQALTRREALAASTDGQPMVRPGSRGDLVLLDSDPLASTDPPVALTTVAGLVAHSTL